MNFFEALVASPLLLSSILAGLAASIVSGIIGSYVVVKRIAFISGSISHSVLAGIGFFLWLERVHHIGWLSPLEGALVAGILSALIIGWVHMRYKQREDSVIAAVWAVGMSIGILFISLTPGFNTDLTNLIVGNLLWVTPSDLTLLGALDLLVIVTLLFLHERLLAICFDEDQASLQGLSVPKLYLLLLTLVGITVVLLMQVVGIVLVMTLLTLPPTIANLFTKRLTHMIGLSIGLSATFTFVGSFLAFQLDWPTGATIALVSGTSYAASLLIKTRETQESKVSEREGFEPSVPV